MELEYETLEPYLSGSQFSNGLTIRLPKMKVVGRLAELKRIATSKRVIHFGYCDHLPLVPQKIESGRWLHSILTGVTTECIGLDIDRNAVETLARDYNIENGFAFDLFRDAVPSEVSENKWDFLVMGEILEHVDNPVSFLSKIHDTFADSVSNLVITVPNAYDLTGLAFASSNAECINSDHRYWFTPYTLTKVAYRAGFRLRAVQMCDESRSRWRRFKLRSKPMCASTIIATFAFSKT